MSFFLAHGGAMSPPGTCEADVRRRVGHRLAELRDEVYQIEKAMAVDGWRAFLVRPTDRAIEIDEWKGADAEAWIEERLRASTHFEAAGKRYKVSSHGFRAIEGCP